MGLHFAIIERAVAKLMELLPFILLDDDCFLYVDSTITLLYLEAFAAPARLILFHSVVHCQLSFMMMIIESCMMILMM